MGKILLKIAELALKGLAKTSKTVRDKMKFIKMIQKVENAVILLLVLIIFCGFFYGLYSAAETICGIPFADDFNKDLKAMCKVVDQIDQQQEKNVIVTPFSNDDIQKMGTDIQKKRNDKIDEVGGGAQRYETKKTYLAKDGTINEAEMQLRILMDIDKMVLQNTELKEKDIKDGKYSGSNVEKIYKIAMAMKDSPTYNQVEPNVPVDLHQGWTFRDWMIYAQSQVYQCYFVGDDANSIWFWNVQKPCKDLRNLNDGTDIVKPDTTKTDPDTGQELKIYGDQGVAKQTQTTYKFQEVCEDPPPPPPPPDNNNNNGGLNGIPALQAPLPVDGGNLGNTPITGPVTSPTNSGIGPIPMFSTIMSLFHEIFDTNVYAKGNDSVIPPTPCPAGKIDKGKVALPPDVEMTYDSIREILDDFKDYSLYQSGYKLIPDNANYEKELEDKIYLVYKEMYNIDPGSMLGGSVFNGWMVPLPEGTYYESSHYGCRNLDGGKGDPRCTLPLNDFHDGIDLAAGGANLGVPIYAMQSGTVIFANPNASSPVGEVQAASMDKDVSGYGGLIIIRHNNGWYSAYGHMLRNNILVQPGWQVNQGQIIAAVGNGAGVPPHLHFQICENPDKTDILCGTGPYNSYGKDPEKDPINLKFNQDIGKVDVTIINKEKAYFNDIKQKIQNFSGSDLEKYVMQLTSGFNTKMPVAQFISGAQGAQQASGIPTSLTLSQIILESSGSHDGLSGLAADAHNLFGIKGTGPAGSVNMPTTEYVNGVPITVNADFRKYNTFDESILDHAALLTNSHYEPFLKGAKTVEDYANGIHQAGYATDPAYPSKLLKIISSNNLNKYDLPDMTFKHITVPWAN